MREEEEEEEGEQEEEEEERGVIVVVIIALLAVVAAVASSSPDNDSSDADADACCSTPTQESSMAGLGFRGGGHTLKLYELSGIRKACKLERNTAEEGLGSPQAPWS